MLKRYEEFLKTVDERLNKYFEEQCEYIKCKEGCSACCEIGEYPFSRLELEYLLSGYSQLSVQKKLKIRNEIIRLKRTKPKMHKCPFLIDKKCSVYKYRGLVCRIHGLAWYDETENRVRLPYCTNTGLNYAKVFDRKTGEVFLQNPIKERLRIDTILDSEEAQKYNLERGEIRPLLKWF
ncbi:YkgJ family cysteine cluster protein [bacterium]|nr:YkgJ family cysteine cluster protein [bacterium]